MNRTASRYIYMVSPVNGENMVLVKIESAVSKAKNVAVNL